MLEVCRVGPISPALSGDNVAVNTDIQLLSGLKQHGADIGGWRGVTLWSRRGGDRAAGRPSRLLGLPLPLPRPKRDQPFRRHSVFPWPLGHITLNRVETPAGPFSWAGRRKAILGHPRASEGAFWGSRLGGSGRTHVARRTSKPGWPGGHAIPSTPPTGKTSRPKFVYLFADLRPASEQRVGHRTNATSYPRHAGAKQHHASAPTRLPIPTGCGDGSAADDALALARTNDARCARAGAVANIDVGEAGFRKPSAILSLGVGLSLVVHAEERKVQIHGLRRR